MLIDWFTVAAQIVNFLILVWLLKHFLYDRIIKVMDEREEKITNRLEEAREKKREADEQVKEYENKQKELEQKRGQLLSEAESKAADKREELIKKAREEADKAHEKWRASLNRHQSSFLNDLRLMAGKEVHLASGRVLNDLADSQLQKKVIDVFLGMLQKLDDSKRTSIKQTLTETSESPSLVSAFELDSNDKRRISKALQKEIGGSINPAYRTDPNLIMGVELKSAGYKISWSVTDYLNQLEEKIQATLEEEIQQGKKLDSDKISKNASSESNND